MELNNVQSILQKNATESFKIIIFYIFCNKMELNNVQNILQRDVTEVLK